MPSWWDEILDEARGAFGAAAEPSQAHSLATLLDPIDPFNRSPVLTPLVRFGGGVALALLGAVAVGSFAVLMLAMLAIVFLLTEVFGYELELSPVPPGA